MKKFVIMLLLGLLTVFVRERSKHGPWFMPHAPVIADVDNGDGTIDYALVGQFSNIYYDVWVLRLPKTYHVNRPAAGGISTTGGGTSFATGPNANSAMFFYIKWPSFEDGYAPTKPPGSAVLTDRSVISISLDESAMRDWASDFEHAATNPFCKWRPTEIPKIFEYAGADDELRCSSGVHMKNFASSALIDGQALLATTHCEDTERNKSCFFKIYVNSRSVTGYFALELLPQLADIQKKITKFLTSATVVDERCFFKRW